MDLGFGMRVSNTSNWFFLLDILSLRNGVWGVGLFTVWASANTTDPMRCIGESFEVGFMRAGALLARPCHFHVKRRTDDARARVVDRAYMGSPCRRVRNHYFVPYTSLGARGAGTGTLGHGLFCFSKNSMTTALPTPRDELVIARLLDVWRSKEGEARVGAMSRPWRERFAHFCRANV
jgi:hypothetical protein